MTKENFINPNDIKLLRSMVDEANIITFYGGAGVSTESGITDYRSKHGVWTKMKENNQNPVYFAHIKRLVEDPVNFFNRPRDKKQIEIKPNATHKILAEWEASGKDIRVITQNVDGLHQAAGHRYVLELHGHHRTWFCNDCGRDYQATELAYDEVKVPRCYVCNGVVRPHVVYFGESADPTTVKKSKITLKNSDLLIIAGTSLATPLAKRLIYQYEGDRIVVINHEPLDISPYEPNLFIQATIGEVFTQVQALANPIK